MSFESNQGSDSTKQSRLNGESRNVRQLQTSSQESVLSELGEAVSKTNEILDQTVKKFSLEDKRHSASDRSHNSKSSLDCRCSRSPSPAGACYRSGETGNFRSDCTLSESKSILRPRSPSPAAKASLNQGELTL